MDRQCIHRLLTLCLCVCSCRSITDSQDFHVAVIEAEIAQWKASKNQAAAIKTIIDQVGTAHSRQKSVAGIGEELRAAYGYQ